MDYMENEYTVDLGSVIRSRFSGIPDFAVRLAEKLFHLDYLNAYFSKGYEGVEFCTECLKYLDVKVDVEGLDKLSASERYTFASNHPLGGIDGIALCDALGPFFGGKIRFVVNDILMNVKGPRPILFPINKMGTQSRDLPSQTDELFRSGNQVLLFPSGKCSRKIDGVIQDPVWKKAFISKSVSFGRKVVPVRFFGENSKVFYFVDNLKNALGIKTNISTVLLPGEVYRGRGKRFRIRIGDPIPPETFDSSRTPLQWAAWVREKVYSM